RIEFRSVSAMDNNKLIQVSGPQFINMIPNAPDMVDNSGNLLWEADGVPMPVNPYAALRNRYVGQTENYINNLVFSHLIIPDLEAKVSLGFNALNVSEKNVSPISAQNPADNPSGKLELGSNRLKSWIIEPQAIYSKKI